MFHKHTLIFLLGFNIFILICIIVLWFIQRNQFYFCESKRRLCRISRITFYVKIAIRTWLVKSTSWTGGLFLFSVIRTLIMFKRQINQLSKGKDARIKTYLEGSTVVTKQDIWNFLCIVKWQGATRSDDPLSGQKSTKSCIGTAKGNNIDVIYIKRNIATTIFTLYGPCQLWFHKKFWKNAFVGGAFNAFTSNRRRRPDMLYNAWYRWLLSNQCCQGTRKIEM